MKRQRLLNVYDCINRIAHNHNAKGVDRSAWFYTDREFEQIKQDKQNNIL